LAVFLRISIYFSIDKAISRYCEFAVGTVTSSSTVA